MKTVLLLLLSCCLMSFTWRTDFDRAKADAAREHKRILLKFSGSDWCIPCIRMEKQLFGNADFDRYADSNLILVNADFPRQKKHFPAKDVVQKNEALAAAYNKEGAFPLTLLLDANGTVLKSWHGYDGTSAADFIRELNSIRP